MKKRIASLIICFVTMFSLLSGCGIFELDQDRYLEQTVASIGDVKISKEKLLMIYNNNINNLMNNGKTREEATYYLLDYMIDEAIYAECAKAYYEDGLTDAQKASAVEDTINYMNDLVANYEQEVRSEWDRKSAFASDDEDSSAVVYEKYEKKAYVVDNGDGTYSIVKTEKDAEEINATYVQMFNDYVDGKEISLMAEFRSKWTPEYEDVGAEALKRIATHYRTQYKSYKTLKDEEILEKVFQKQLKNNIEYTWMDAITENEGDKVIEDITMDMIMQEYYSLVAQSKQKYTLAGVGATNYVSDILNSSSKDVYYNLSADDGFEGDFFYVSNVLLAFNDEQKAEIEKMKKRLEAGGISQNAYDLWLEDLAKDITVEAKDEDGKGTGVYYTAQEILAEMQDALKDCVTPREKALAYNKFVYKYNSDQGIQNAEKDYVLGTDVEGELRSNMVESFTDASRELYEAGVVGAISGLVLSDYGYHIIQYTGKIENIDVGSAKNENDEACYILDNKYMALHGEKTYFDEILEILIDRNTRIADKKASFLNDYKSQYQLKIYTDRIKELYE